MDLEEFIKGLQGHNDYFGPFWENVLGIFRSIMVFRDTSGSKESKKVWNIRFQGH